MQDNKKDCHPCLCDGCEDRNTDKEHLSRQRSRFTIVKVKSLKTFSSRSNTKNIWKTSTHLILPSSHINVCSIVEVCIYWGIKNQLYIFSLIPQIPSYRYLFLLSPYAKGFSSILREHSHFWGFCKVLFKTLAVMLMMLMITSLPYPPTSPPLLLHSSPCPCPRIYPP